jgi:hypothetical protein
LLEVLKMKYAIAFALALIAASPAMAGSNQRGHWGDRAGCRNLSAGDQACGYGSRGDRFSVYSYDGRLIGRDPDPNIRKSLRDEDARYRWR